MYYKEAALSAYMIRRVLVAAPTLIGVTIFAFLLLRVLPGDVAEMLLRGESGEGAAMPWTIELLQEELGLNRPLVIQYFTWLKDIARGDLGESLWTGRSVRAEILHRLPLTIQIAVMAELMGLAIGVPMGIIAATRQDTPIDYAVRFWSIGLMAIPDFWLGLMVVLTFVRLFDWMPPIGYYLLWADPRQNILQLFWPAAVIATNEWARVGRMTRSTVLEVLREDYIRTARAKGLSERLVLFRHALKNAFIPIITFVSIYLGALLGGTVVLEYVFNVPGIGTHFLEALRFRDYPVVQALILFFATGFFAINLAVDILYGWLDPRISHG